MSSDLNQLLVFAKVVEQGSFIGAARALALPKTTISRKVQELEERLGTRLLQRTTRRVSLTEAGAIYYEYCGRIVQELEDADKAVGRVQEEPRGVLRVSASFSFGMSTLVPIVPEFMARYPDIQLSLELRNDVVDLVAEGFDLAILIGPVSDSSNVMRRLGESRMRLFATPEYLRQYGSPATPDELTRLPTLTHMRFKQHGRFLWPLRNGSEARDIYPTPRLVANDPGVLRFATLAGLGIGLLPELLTRHEIDSGRLVPVLPDWEAPRVEFGAVYPSRRGLPPKVRVFIDFIVERLALFPGRSGDAA
ncbi:LysR family transcriptional regulator [Rhodocyclus tenuis]|uniref:LysR family transcriptional regulator n=2 Tax=Rhodocyclus TaxID=1064 RepID=A0A6L5K119_RHOTE|nr:LysR family transcriptional regulator [Rhodocyclus gracilis]MQY52540.1 LysR family transcriptional regulator [Rhodocyclus gracilis]MRD73985.1 LysR family transcriptional regulator [Rhodocyclus gracilis]NJA90007.1 LysR family transcriptional regulator [Rhodocyclus gracilis]